MTRYFCTLFDKDFLLRGLVLYESLEEYCPDFQLFVLCMDDETEEILKKLDLPMVRLISLVEFETASLKKARKERTHEEYCWTCASSLLYYLLKKYRRIDLLTYLDTDMRFYSSPEPLFREMGNGSVLIVPHHFPPSLAFREKEVGKFNVSWVTFRQSRDGLECLDWWRSETLKWCFYRSEDGKLGDQKYLNEFPRRFRGVVATRNIGAGVAHWNIFQYRMSQKRGRIYFNKSPLVFFHFEGLKISSLPFLSSILNRNPIYTRWSLYWRPLFASYIERLYYWRNIVCQVAPGFNNGFEKHFLWGFGVTYFKKKKGKLSWVVHTRLFSCFSAPGAKFLERLRRQTDMIINPLQKMKNYLWVLETYFRQDECQKLYDCLLLGKIRAQQPPASDRYIEYPWVWNNLTLEKGKILEVGATSTAIWRYRLPQEVEIYALDFNHQPPQKGIKFTRGDVRRTGFQRDMFDTVICVSTLEHIGVAGRYGSDDDPGGDARAMAEIKRILKLRGVLLLTVPYGVRDALPINKLYNKSRLGSLLNGFKVEDMTFMKFNRRFGYWFKVSEEEAAKTDMFEDQWYAIALIKAVKE